MLVIAKGNQTYQVVKKTYYYSVKNITYGVPTGGIKYSLKALMQQFDLKELQC